MAISMSNDHYYLTRNNEVVGPSCYIYPDDVGGNCWVMNGRSWLGGGKYDDLSEEDSGNDIVKDLGTHDEMLKSINTMISPKVLLLLGKNDEYLTYKAFHDDVSLDKYLEDIMPMIMLNIKESMPLRKRLLLLPKDEQGNPQYFPYAGAVQGIEVINLNPSLELTD